jgi:hypothetical protein
MLSVMISAYRFSDGGFRGCLVSDFTSRLPRNAPAGICGDGQHHARFGGGGCGPERCDKGSRCATPAIPAGHVMTKVMIARLSQPGIAGLLPAPCPGTG